MKWSPQLSPMFKGPVGGLTFWCGPLGQLYVQNGPNDFKKASREQEGVCRAQMRKIGVL